MKKNYIAFAVLAALALTSCVEEKSFKDHIVGKNEIAFVLQSGATRAAEAGSPVTKGITAPIGRIDNLEIFLDETITDLDFVAPETRGTPVYTENVGTLYKNQLFVHANGFGDATFETMDDARVENSGWRYNHNYGSNLWPSDGSAVDFHLLMPSSPKGVSNLTYAAGAKTSFSYESPTTAVDQQDLIVSGTTLTEAQHKGYLPNGAPVTFYHALTAVKFAIANDDEELSEKGIVVTNIAFTGLINKGTCTFDPSASSKISWASTSVGTDDEEKPNVISQDFGDGETNITFAKASDENGFADSFFEAGNEKNINAADASKTFWLIPQAFANSVAVLRISYTMSGKDEYMDIPLKELLSSVTWLPGQLRTYTFRLNQVNVKIDDDVTINGRAEDGFEGSIKQNIDITNTGTVPAFIRAAIVGQWLDKDDNPVFGFTDKVNNLYLVESWYEDQFVKTDPGTHGTFVGLPGYKGAASTLHDWTLCTDGFYYYNKKVAVGATIPDDIFTSYTVGELPDAEISGKPIEDGTMYFILEIATQAVSAKKALDGSEFGETQWAEAWENATGVKPVEK